jgi:UDP-N-acetylmuramoyl-tripeptide--D-alanyl-D-alanine ligase
MRIALKIPLKLDEIVSNTSLTRNFSKNCEINAICTNSKEAMPGDLFIALTGENHNGEDYTNEARKRGSFILSSNDMTAEIIASDTSLALLEIAAFYKTKLKKLRKTIAITGSVGKTTTKNILSDMLSSFANTHATEGNYNNLIGVSYTILSASCDCEYLVTEIGMNHKNEISTISKAIKPDIAIITNIGTAHIGNLGSREMIANAKLEILDGMKKEKLIVPYGEPLLIGEARYTVGINCSDAQCTLNTKETKINSSSFDITYSGNEIKNVSTKIGGEHNLLAIANAVAVLDILDFSKEDIRKAIASINSQAVRGRFIQIGNISIFDDAYNSSLESVIADFKLLSMEISMVKTCVLGDMLELGKQTEKMHIHLGEMAYKYGFKKMYLFGVYSPFIAKGAMDCGMPPEKIFINTDITAPKTTAEQILKNYTSGEIILFKASNKLNINRIYQYLK